MEKVFFRMLRQWAGPRWRCDEMCLADFGRALSFLEHTMYITSVIKISLGGVMDGSASNVLPSLSTEELVAWRLRGCQYTHEGVCTGYTCMHCYKYQCADCGERSNRMMTCGFCAVTQIPLASHCSRPQGVVSTANGVSSSPERSASTSQ